MSAAAMIAKAKGYEVSGCDLTPDTVYSKELIDSGISIKKGHDEDHIEASDIVATTPAVFFQNNDNPEVSKARKDGALITWQEFLGKYLHEDHEVICIAGTHGKSTTTGMAALMFEQTDLDPSVVVGATIKEWKANYRVGNGKYFITEADEFFNNFLNYSPDIIVLNNIEFDHPDFFKNEDEVIESFKKFTEKLKGEKTLIFNQDSEGIQKLLSIVPKDVLDSINLIGYTLGENTMVECDNSFVAKDISFSEQGSIFKVENKYFNINQEFKLNVPGKFNISNCLGVIALGLVSKIDTSKIMDSLGRFTGVGRRMELAGEIRGVTIFDDYGHHPTAIKATLDALRQKYRKNKIWAIIEPHTYSRTKALLHLYKDSLGSANEVIIAPIFKSRDNQTFGVNEESIVGVSGHNSIRFIDSFDKIIENVKAEVKSGDVIIVMGAGLSYKLTEEIIKSL